MIEEHAILCTHNVEPSNQQIATVNVLYTWSEWLNCLRGDFFLYISISITCILRETWNLHKLYCGTHLNLLRVQILLFDLGNCN